MGVVYTGVELMQGRIPTSDQHIAAARGVLEVGAALDEVELMVVHGSVTEGRSNVRSDLDVFIEYPQGNSYSERDTIGTIKRGLGSIAAATNVRIESAVWPASEPRESREGRFTDILFSRYLAERMKLPEWRVGEPDEEIFDIALATEDPLVVRRAASSYSAQKHSSFIKAPHTFSEDKSCLAVVQRTLELPKAIRQKVGQLTMAFDSGSALTPVETLETFDGTEQLLASMGILDAMDREYTQLIEGGVTEEDRAQVVAEHTKWLQDRYPNVVRLGLGAAMDFIQFLPQYHEIVGN